MSTVGFIGLGNMGGFMARNLLKKGRQLVVFDVDKKKSDLLVQFGATLAADPAEVGDRASEVIFTMLPNSSHVDSVFNGDNGILQTLKPNSLCIDCSTIDPVTTANLAKQTAEKKSTFLDAPVSGGVVGAECGTLTFMVGGPNEGFEQAKPYFQEMGKNAVYCGEVGAGQSTKICNNMLLGIHMIGVAEALNLGVKLGLDPKRLTEIINTSSGRCWSTDTYNPVPGVMENVPSCRGYSGGFGNSLMAKDLGIAQNVATEFRAPIPLGSLAHQMYRILSSLPDYKDKDFGSVYEFLCKESK
ncbi:3-hydroxyisobutyrate dehydrogenase [Aphelenchoides besseyi]|nr:3-hydroxyisobutyrate dehydrogenase [Aphelenchoides besseyi]KAI6201329.1 3-hydroxyisobutyrate dehydrogenase [Aphelenchoides besseyi]